LVAVALVLVASCGPEGGDSEDLTAASAPTALTAEDIAERRASWERAAPEAYRYVITSTCGCERSGRFTVTVVGDEVASVDRADAPDGERYRQWFGQSVDQMFVMFEEAVGVATQEGADAQATASFDPERGHPQSFTVRWTSGERPYEAVLTGFEPIDPGDAERPAADAVPILVTNQSFDHPDAHVTVAVDGDVVIESVFPVGGQHHVVHYQVPMQPGRHEVEATSDAGARLTQVVDVPRDAPLFLFLSHHGTIEGSRPPPAHFELRVDDEPVAIG
jgi:hypothetical protein